MIIKKHFRFSSSDGLHKIHGIMWKPDHCEIIGFLQIMHGMVEHIDRYDAFARYMCDHGFAVAGEDHLGHGYSVKSDDEFGYFAKKYGTEYVIADNYRLKKHMEREFAGVPYFILGHSMGSFIARIFTARHSEELAGAIIMGTGNQSPLLAGAGKLLATVIAKVKGDTYRSQFVNNIAFGAYNKKFQPERTAYDWLTKDESIVDAYMKSKFCTFIFTVSAYKDLFTFVQESGKIEVLRKIRPELPMLVISGAQDPVGDFGRGVKGVYEKLKDADIEDVTLELYENDRHEILNETDRPMVYEDILNWILSKMPEKADA